jgi:hypothetical protein
MLEGPECKIRIKNPDTRWQLRLKIKRTNRKAFELEFVKRATRMFSGLWKVRDWTMWRGQHPLE